MRHSQSRSTRFVARASAALIGLARLLARQAAREAVASDSGRDQIAREETAAETSLNLSSIEPTRLVR